MDDKTKRVLMNIHKSIPKEWIKKGIKTEKPYQFQQDLIDNESRSGDYKKREMFKRLAEDPRVRATNARVSTSVDPEISAKIDKFVQTKVEKAIASGEIEKAKKTDFHKYAEAHFKRK